MDEQLKQKILIAALAVLVLGAGSWFFLFRDSGAGGSQAIVEGPVERAKRADTGDTGRSARAKRETARAPGSRDETVRQERRERGSATDTRRGVRGRIEREEKKKKVSPAA